MSASPGKLRASDVSLQGSCWFAITPTSHRGAKVGNPWKCSGKRFRGCSGKPGCSGRCSIGPEGAQENCRGCSPCGAQERAPPISLEHCPRALSGALPRALSEGSPGPTASALPSGPTLASFKAIPCRPWPLRFLALRRALDSKLGTPLAFADDVVLISTHAQAAESLRVALHQPSQATKMGAPQAFWTTIQALYPEARRADRGFVICGLLVNT